MSERYRYTILLHWPDAPPPLNTLLEARETSETFVKESFLFREIFQCFFTHFWKFFRQACRFKVTIFYHVVLQECSSSGHAISEPQDFASSQLKVDDGDDDGGGGRS